jgi:hypothetical protein
MLKKLASLLFEEEEEKVETVELDPVDEPEISPSPSMIQAMNPEVARTQINDLEVQHFEWPEEDVEANEPSTVTMAAEPTVSSPSKSYEFRPVMSPIFGVSEKDRVQPERKNVELKPYPSSSSRINTIISPIYGDLKQDDLKIEVNEGLLKVSLERSVLDEQVIDEMDLDDLLHSDEDTPEEELLDNAPSEDNFFTQALDNIDSSGLTSPSTETLEASSEEALDPDAHQYSLFDEDANDKL